MGSSETEAVISIRYTKFHISNFNVLKISLSTSKNLTKEQNFLNFYSVLVFRLAPLANTLYVSKYYQK